MTDLTPANELVEKVAQTIDPDAWHSTLRQDGLACYWHKRRENARNLARAVVALALGEAAWQLSPVPTDRPIIGLPYTLDGTDASVTWWLQTEGRWANWHWSEPPIGWMPLPPDPDQSALIPEAKP